MIKVAVFYGSFQEFQSNYDLNPPYIKISDIVEEAKEMMEKDKTDSLNNHVDKFVCLTEEYSQLSDTGVRGLHEYVQKRNLKYIILQNPPKLVLDNFKRLENQIDLEVTINYADHNDITKEDLLNINNLLDDRIIGQCKAKDEILTSLYTLYKKRNKNKLVELMLYGPSGIGKTETAKIINEVIGGELQRLNMSMFQNQYYINYLFGESHNAKSFAVDLLERQPNVILLDEFDKAPTVVHNAFYKAFDESEFDDSHYQVSLDNILIICTSNYQTKSQIQEDIGSPLYNRFNDIIQYKQLSYSEINKVIDKVFDIKYCELDEQEQIAISELSLKEVIKDYIHSEGYNNFRSIENSIERLFNHILLKKLISGSEFE